MSERVTEQSGIFRTNTASGQNTEVACIVFSHHVSLIQLQTLA